MTNKEICEAILKRRGYTQYHGNKDNLSSITYFFLMDASRQFFDDVKKQDAKGQQKKLRNQMEQGYHLFFKNFFSAFNAEQTDYIMDKVDSFEEYLSHHICIAEIAMQECDNSKPIEVQREMSRVWLCNILAADAQDYHGECWKTGSAQNLYDRYIDQVIKASKEYARLRFGEGPSLTEKQFVRVQQAIKIIANKVVQWVVQDYKNELAKKNESVDSEEVHRQGESSLPCNEGDVGRGHKESEPGSSACGVEGDGRNYALGGRNDNDSSGPDFGKESRNHFALQRAYGGFPVIPRVRR